MKKIIKQIYMLVFHPLLFFRFHKKGLFVKGRANIKTLRKMRVEDNVHIGYDARINFFNDINEECLILGKNTYICNHVSFIIGAPIYIGSNVLIGSDVCIVSENHGMDPSLELAYMHQELICKPITVESGVWIGEKTIILPGVCVGEKSILAAGSVVTKNVPPLSIVAGNPAKILKQYDINKNEWIKYYD